MESIPETKIKMMNGYYYLVKDSEDSVRKQIREWFGYFGSSVVQG